MVVSDKYWKTSVSEVHKKGLNFGLKSELTAMVIIGGQVNAKL